MSDILVLADDLIWASRLVAAVERAGARPVRLSGRGALDGALEERRATGDAAVRAAIVDLGGRRYDGVQAVTDAAAAGLTVLAVAQHEDLELRRRALAAGAVGVVSYNRFFSNGPAIVARWLLEPAVSTAP